MTDKEKASIISILPAGWRGLGLWNYYFLIKFALLWGGYLDFHSLDNLAFVSFILFPIRNNALSWARGILAIFIGFALFWHDTWLPGPGSIMHQGDQVAQFSWSYLFELFQRFINYKMIEIGFIIFVGYLFLSLWFRITAMTVLVLLGISVGPSIRFWLESVVPLHTASGVARLEAPGRGAQSVLVPASSSEAGEAALLPPSESNLNAWLANFYTSEEKRRVSFATKLPESAQPFELLIINICSLSWSDLVAAGLDSHPLWSRFDFLFKNFNSATSYSGPAAIRLLRASCGQLSHKALYGPVNQECYLFSDLAKLGFTQRFMLDHTGVFGDFLKEINQFGGMQVPLMRQDGLPVNLLGFDNSPIYDDAAVLQRWLETEDSEKVQRSATFYNLLPLHDGNHFPGMHNTADYTQRARKLFDELDQFLTKLEQSRRKVMVVIVPEHGAALQGDKMQISGLRDIPSPSITHVPVGIKFTGLKVPHSGMPLSIAQPSSYLAISTLVSRVVDGQIFVADSVDWAALVRDLPVTVSVAENADSIVVDYGGKPYVNIDHGDWVAYPQ